MSAWKFQIYPAQPDKIGPRFAMDAVARAFERRVNDAFRLPFRFHKLSKLCICLGPGQTSRPEYKEALGVVDMHYPSFSYSNYLSASDGDRTQMIEEATRSVCNRLLENFADANFVLVAAKNLGWKEFAEPHSSQGRMPR
jgi:hypothetical protein